jgi:hypothetical protein
LAERDINVRHVRRFVAVGLDVAGDANDGQALQTAAKIKFQFLADRIGVGPILLCEPLIDDGDAARFVCVEIGEIATRGDRHFHRLEITVVDDGDVGKWLMAAIVGASGDREERIVAAGIHGQRVVA